MERKEKNHLKTPFQWLQGGCLVEINIIKLIKKENKMLKENKVFG